MIRRLAIAMLACAPLGAGAENLLQVYRDARSYDAQFAAARQAALAGQERVTQGRALLLPSLNLTANAARSNLESDSKNVTVQPSYERTVDTYGYSLTFTQPIYRRQNWLQADQGELQARQAELQYNQAHQDLILRAAQAYFDVLAAQDTLALVRAQKAAIQEQLAQAKRNFEVGTATITDTHEAQSRYDLTVSLEITAKNDLEVRKRFLELIIGRPAPAIAPLGPKFGPRFPEPNEPAAWVETAGTNNPQVRISQASLDFATKEVERNRAGHRPTLDAFATYTDSGSGAGTVGIAGTDTKAGVVGLQLAIPIYQGGLTTSRVREALANEEKARQDLENARRTAQLTAQQTFLGVATGVSQVRALEAALVSSQSSLDSTRLGQEVGVRTVIDVLNAQQQLSQTRRDLAQAKYNYILSLLRLKAASGQLSEQDLAQINAWLDR